MNGLYYYYRGNRAAVKRAARWGKDVYHMMRGKRWVCLALCLLTLLGTVQVSAAAIIALRPTFVDITGDDCRVYEQSADIGTLSYSAMAAPDSLSSAGIGQEAVMEGGVQTGTMVTLTMNSSQKAQLRLAVFSTKLWVPAHTKYTVKHSFTVSGSCDAASFQLVSLGTSCRLSGATLSPFMRDAESEEITGGLSTGTALAQGLQPDGDVITAEHTYPYENTTDTGKYISQYFALWAAARHDDTGRGQAAVTCTLTTKAAQTTAEVTLLKDDQPWTGQTVGVSCGAGADDYRFTETADGVYTCSGSGGDAIFPLDGTKFSIYLKGDALKVYDTMAYPTDAQDGPYQKTIDYYTITYSTGDATGGTLPDNDIEKIGTLYAVSYEKSLTKEGYQQVGWSKSPSGTVVHHILVFGKATLYPVWAAKTGVSSGGPGKTLISNHTGDAGIVLYGLLSLAAIAGTAVLLRKRRTTP